jgi:hypothetical protein
MEVEYPLMEVEYRQMEINIFYWKCIVCLETDNHV